jgi:hypothetical protein
LRPQIIGVTAAFVFCPPVGKLESALQNAFIADKTMIAIKRRLVGILINSFPIKLTQAIHFPVT